jgi:Tfp pilus assembly protein PilV
MKKLLNIIGASVILSSSAVVASCSLDPSAPIEINDAIDLQNFFNKLQTNRPELSEDFNVGFEGQNDTYIKALEKIFDQEQVVHTAFINKLLSTDFYANKDNVLGYDIQKTGKTLGKTSLVRNADHKVNANVADKNLSDYFYEKVAKPDEKPVDNAKELSDVIKTLALGEIANKDSATILAAINSKNGTSLTSKDVTVAATSDTAATVTPVAGSTLVKGAAVTVTFTLAKPDNRKDLAKVVTITELGEISGSDATTIVNAMNDKNTDLNLTETDVDVAPNGDDAGATVTAKTESENFIGTVDVTFTVAKPDDRKDLAKVVTVTDLGEISGSDATTIVNAINDKNTDLNLTETDVDVAPNGDDAGATVTAKTDSENFTGTVDVTFTVAKPDDRKDLAKVVTVTDLGEISGSDATTIVNAINDKNTDLNLTETDVDVAPNGDDTGATVTAKTESENFTGTVDVTFTVAKPDERKDLAEVVAVTELGEISGSDATTVVKAINDKNADLNLTETDVDVTPNGDDTGATVTAKDESEKFKGAASVTFTVTPTPEKTDLADAVKVLALGEIADTDAATIVTAMNTANEGLGLTETDVEITPNEDSTGATVTASTDSASFTGSVDVTFTLPAETNYYSILNSHRLLADGPQYSYSDYTMTIMIGSDEDLFNLDHDGFVYIPFTILPK